MGNAEIVKPWDTAPPNIGDGTMNLSVSATEIAAPGARSQRPNIPGIEVACYFGLSYGLYLLEHNVELQQRLIRRLKDRA